MSYHVATNSPLELRLTFIVQAIVESGLFQKYGTHSMDLIRRIPKATMLFASALDSSFAASYTSFTIEQIMPYFIVCNIGFMISLLVFIGEIIYFKWSIGRQLLHI